MRTPQSATELKVGVAGVGALGGSVCRRLLAGMPGLALAATATRRPDRRPEAVLESGVPNVSLEKLPQLADCVVECLAPDAFCEIAVPTLDLGKRLIVASSGALLLNWQKVEARRQYPGQFIIPSGAILGLDGVRAACETGDVSAVLISRKPPVAFAEPGNAPAVCVSGGRPAPKRIFSGNALQAVAAYPRNANVAATVALAGVGIVRTSVEIWIDPGQKGNVHELTVTTPRGQFRVVTSSAATAENPRSSSMTADSILSELRILGRTVFELGRSGAWAGMENLVSLDEVRSTRAALPKAIRRTPVIPLAPRAGQANETLYIKAENLQVTGAYKPRAAFARMAAIPRPRLDEGVVLTSSGNFAQAFALAGALLRAKVVCVMLDHTSAFKVEAARSWGAEVVFCGNEASARQQWVNEIAEERGMYAIDTWEDREIIAGHGSIGLEILEDLPDVATVLVPVSSGGGAAGIAAAIKESRPNVTVVGVQPTGANAAYLSRRAGRLVTIENWNSMADGLSAVRPGEFPFAHLEKYLDDIVLVTESDILEACRAILFRCKLVAEPAGAVAAAAALAGKVCTSGKTLAVVTGGNVTQEKVASWLSG